MPVLSGGGTTPKERVDIIAGGAARIPLGEIQSDKESFEALRYSESGGMSPLFATRLPVTRQMDASLRFAGSAIRIDTRYSFRVIEQLRLIGSLAPYIGWLPQRDPLTEKTGRGIRYGIDVPWVLGFSIAGIYEVWSGLHVGLDGIDGSIDNADHRTHLSGQGVRPGAIVGFAAGFRHFHTLVELTVDYEWWEFGQEENHRTISGISLTPAFAIRLRF